MKPLPFPVFRSANSAQSEPVRFRVVRNGMSWGVAPPAGTWTGTPDTSTKVLPELKDKTEQATPWHVVVLNDPVNLMSYVTMVIQRIFGYSETKATLMMMDVHQKGSCIVWTGEKEKAEFYLQQLQSYQLLCTLRKAQE